MYRLDAPDLTDAQVIAVRVAIATEVLSDLAREWLEEEPVTLAGLLRQVLAQVESEE